MLRFGIIGFGLHAVKRLMPGFRQAKNCRVTALSRRDPEGALASAREHGIPHAFTTAEELCRSPEVDAVFIATPDNCHLHDALAALDQGKPVLLEKPMAMNAGEARQMVVSARRTGVLLGVAHVFRFAETMRRLRERVAAGEIGRVALARSEFCYSVAPGHPRKWIHDPAIAAGGPIADVGVHCIDALRFILGDDVTRVAAVAHGAEGRMESTALVSLEFRQSAMGAVLVSALAPYRTPLEIVGEGGVLRADDALSVDRPVAIELRRDRHVHTEHVSNHLAYTQQVEAFADAVEGRAPFPVPGEEGLKNQLILDAAYRSLRTGSTETIASSELPAG